MEKVQLLTVETARMIVLKVAKPNLFNFLLFKIIYFMQCDYGPM